PAGRRTTGAESRGRGARDPTASQTACRRRMPASRGSVARSPPEAPGRSRGLAAPTGRRPRVPSHSPGVVGVRTRYRACWFLMLALGVGGPVGVDAAALSGGGWWSRAGAGRVAPGGYPVLSWAVVAPRVRILSRFVTAAAKASSELAAFSPRRAN